MDEGEVNCARKVLTSSRNLLDSLGGIPVNLGERASQVRQDVAYVGELRLRQERAKAGQETNPHKRS